MFYFFSLQEWAVGYGNSDDTYNKTAYINENKSFFIYRSELVIEHTGVGDNGTYYCQAENKAARSISNFTLHVTDRDLNPDAPTILQVRLG